MARLVLTFKGKIQQLVAIEASNVSIGSAAENTIRIDSLAIAPYHAQVSPSADGVVVRQLDQGYPLLVNNRQINEQVLSNGDCIRLGKHEIYFRARAEEDTREAGEETAAVPAIELPPAAAKHREAGLQMMNGKQIGVVIPLKGPLTRLGKEETGFVLIVRRKDGYFLSALDESTGVMLNDQPVSQSAVQLGDGDVINLNQRSLRFIYNKA